MAVAATTSVLMQLLYFWKFTATEVAIAEHVMDPSVEGSIILPLTMVKPGCFAQKNVNALDLYCLCSAASCEIHPSSTHCPTH